MFCQLCNHPLRNTHNAECLPGKLFSFYRCYNKDCESNYTSCLINGDKETEMWEHRANGLVSVVENNFTKKFCKITTRLPNKKVEIYNFNIPAKKFKTYIMLI